MRVYCEKCQQMVTVQRYQLTRAHCQKVAFRATCPGCGDRMNIVGKPRQTLGDTPAWNIAKTRE
ncbi:MAG: hypothetical protein PHQ43_00585 [Dehalococcoidales bacterium]|nr:hypothetical protein [Dehalococcoidales bacterium]